MAIIKFILGLGTILVTVTLTTVVVSVLANLVSWFRPVKGVDWVNVTQVLIGGYMIIMGSYELGNYMLRP